MKRIVLVATMVFSILLSFGQKQDETEMAFELVKKNSKAIGLSNEDIANSVVSNTYKMTGTDITLVYLQQSFKGIPVYNQLKVLAFQNGTLVSNSGTRIKAIETKVNTLAAAPVVNATSALRAALESKKINAPETLLFTFNSNTNKFEFGNAGVSNEVISAELMWVPINDGRELKLAWQIYIVPVISSDYWLIRVDATDNTIIEETNLTVYCDFGGKNHKHNLGSLNYQEQKHTSHFTKTSIFDFTSSANQNNKIESPEIVNDANYRIIPFPAESPKHPGGNHALVSNPWTKAPGNATSLKWHYNGTSDYNITRGNNVWATEDRAAANNSAGLPATSTTSPDPLNFDFTPNFGKAPTERTPVPNQQFNTTNLFYWNNIIHDLTYQYGFDEVAGNFQQSNQGRGGAGGDYVMADAQDGGGTMNANFSTPADGGRGRMQMYLWDTATLFTVNTPASIAGYYTSVESVFSTANKLFTVGPITRDVVYYNDDAGGTTHRACNVTGAPANTLTDKTVIINRGGCPFTEKVKNAQTAGAKAVIMVDSLANNPPFGMGGTDNTITIPAVMISLEDGAILKTQLANNLNVTLGSAIIDGDVDNGVITHEFAHGISNRLTGGPSQSGCVSNAEHMGEGWSDYYSLMATQDWTTATLTTGFDVPRAIGTYASGQSINGAGIRSQKYCTNFAVNNKVFSANLPGTNLQHDRGEIWCATLWDMTWNIINQVGSINPNIFNVAGGGGNVIAMKLVTEAMKLQPCSPGFLDARDAIFQADQLLYNGAYSCAIKEAFRRRGMGPLAKQGSADNVNDQVPDYTSTLSVKLSANVTQIPEGQNIVYTNTVTTCSPVSNYLLTDTLPTNVTYVSGGSYNAATRVVSFPVNLTQGQTQTYSFTVQVNNGAFYNPTDLINEAITGTSIPALFTTTSTTSNVWTVSSAQSRSTPSSLFTPNADVPSVQVLATTNAIALGTNQSSLSFWHWFDTELGYDGGIVEISTDNGVTWKDLNNQWVANKYNNIINTAAATSIADKPAFSGNSLSFIQSAVNLSSFANQSVKLRWSFVSDNGTGGTGWYIDDILLRNEAVVNMRSSLFATNGTRLDYTDTVTYITTAACADVAISTPPANVNACAGGNATFTVTATGTNPTYQWQVSTNGGSSWTDVSGQTSATLTLTAVTIGMNNHQYRVIISNTCPSSVTSTVATLTVTDPATISSQPVNTTVCEGANANFAVTASGANITYQWQVSTDGGTTFTNISGQTAAALSLTSVTAAMNNNQYRVVVFSCSPNGLNSSAATLTVQALVSITSQPSNTAGCTNGTASFAVVASGTSNNYQWQVSTDGGASWTTISGQTAATLSLSGLTIGMNNNQYHVIVSNACTTTPVTSSNATLTVTNAAGISTQPVNSTVCAGSDASFSAVATGISYQWQVSTDGGVTYTDISGATSATLNLNAVTASMNNNKYRLVVTSCNPPAVTSDVVTLTVNSGASISSQPTDKKVCVGTNTTLSVIATGTNLSYQWQISTDGGITYTDISGAVNSSLNITAATLSQNNNRYRVVLITAAPCADVTSSVALLTVNDNPTVGTTVSPASPVCAGSTITLNGSGASSYTWDNGVSNNVPFTINATTTYTVTGTDLNGCSNTAVQLVTTLTAPVVNISANPYTSLYQGLTTTLTATSTPSSTSYNWFKNDVLMSGSNGTSIVVDASGIGNYKAALTDANGCTGTSNVIAITDSVLLLSFIYPNPNNGQFTVSLYTPNPSGQTRILTIYDEKGAKLYEKAHVITMSNQKMDVDIRRLSASTYMVLLYDSNGNRIAEGKVVKQN